jgi:hydroxymethylpyrimidine/phosphomethylpyrimidine kinase
LVSLLGELFDGPVVCDPPPPFDSAARGNSALSNNAALHRLFTRCRLITPTRPVAAALENSALSTRQQVRNASKSLRFLGSRAVLIRDTEPRALGAHVLFDGIQIHEFVAPKQGIDQRGLASAIACALAFNLSLPEAVTNAAAYMRKQSVSAEPR